MSLFVLKLLNSLFKLLNSETSPWQMGAGFAFGMLVGLSPLMSLHNLVVFLVVCLLRVNLGMFFWAFGIFRLMAWIFDSALDSLGYWILVDWTSMRESWISISSGAVWPFFRFNNTIIMGALAVGVVLWIPIFGGSVWAIRAYRQRWRARMANSRFVKALKATPIYSLYERVQNLREKMSVLS